MTCQCDMISAACPARRPQHCHGPGEARYPSQWQLLGAGLSLSDLRPGFFRDVTGPATVTVTVTRDSGGPTVTAAAAAPAAPGIAVGPPRRVGDSGGRI